MSDTNVEKDPELNVANIAASALVVTRIETFRDKLTKEFLQGDRGAEEGMTDLGRELAEEVLLKKLANDLIGKTLQTMEDHLEIQVRFTPPNEPEVVAPVTGLTKAFWESVNS